MITYNRWWRVGRNKFKTREEAEEYCKSQEEISQPTESSSEETSSDYQSSPTWDFSMLNQSPAK